MATILQFNNAIDEEKKLGETQCKTPTFTCRGYQINNISTFYFLQI